MQRLETVLGERKPDLVQVLVRRGGLTPERAERFVALAGDDLIESFEWQHRELESRPLAEPSTARDVLSAMAANRIASSLGLSRSQVWEGLRALVPSVLCLAEHDEAA
jgi:polyhydroxyalkanoate synthesis regulator phasin